MSSRLERLREIQEKKKALKAKMENLRNKDNQRDKSPTLKLRDKIRERKKSAMMIIPE